MMFATLVSPQTTMYIMYCMCEHKPLCFFCLLQIARNVVQIIDNITQWRMEARDANASRSVFMCMVSCHIGID